MKHYSIGSYVCVSVVNSACLTCLLYPIDVVMIWIKRIGGSGIDALLIQFPYGFYVNPENVSVSLVGCFW
jgi:hypothetical protein